jgi:hypothetical protein
VIVTVCKTRLYAPAPAIAVTTATANPIASATISMRAITAKRLARSSSA